MKRPKVRAPSQPNKIDVRVIISNPELCRFMRDDAQRNERDLQGQIRVMLLRDYAMQGEGLE